MRHISIINQASVIKLWNKHFIRMLQTFIFSTLLFLSGSGNLIYAQPQQSNHTDLSVELTVLYNANLKTIKVLKQRILNFPPPKNRSKKLEGEQFVFQYEDGLGVVLGSVPVNDPTILRSEWEDDRISKEPGLLTGKKLAVAETVFQVIIPFNENLDRVMLLKPKARQKGIQAGQIRAKPLRTDSPAERFDVIGKSPVDRAAIKAFINRKKQ